jgi:peptidoglycan/xylan/chitin deacetylase (PgdA/CDA1 family)
MNSGSSISRRPNQRRMEFAGTAMRLLGGGLASKRLPPAQNIRVTYSHFVLKEELDRFAEIIAYIASRRKLIAPGRFFNYYDDDDAADLPPDGGLLMTFDDGLVSSYEAAQQILNPRGIKAIFFIPTAILELASPVEMRRFAWERIYDRSGDIDALRVEEYVTMGVDHLRELAGQGHMILPHTHSHAKLSGILTAEDVQRELVRPKRILEDLLGSTVRGFTPPVGTERVISSYAYEHARDIYSFCFTSLAGMNTTHTNRSFLYRDCVEASFSLNHVRNVLDGVYDPYYGFKSRRLRRRARPPPGGPARDDRFDSATAERSRSGQAHRRLPADKREAFIQTVTEAFENAGVDHVFLHAYGPGRVVDSDIDVAVSRASRPVVDAIVRSGAFGRVVQRHDWGVPWCRYYVVETAEIGRRYRQLDLISDPWGIGRDGLAVPLALSSAQRGPDGCRIPSAAAETVYLAVKRARKRMHRPEDQASIVLAFERDPVAAGRLLERHFGAPGESLARALEQGKRDLSDELDSLREFVSWQRRRPSALIRRAAFATARYLLRLLRPSGLVVCLAGPDGVGKSTLARELQSASGGAFRRSLRLHLRPGLLPAPGQLLRRASPDTSAPHGRPASGRLGSLTRLGYLWFDTLVGWGPKIAVPTRRSSLVVLERGWLDLAVDPRRYRLSVTGSLVRALGRFLPRPDLTLVLNAPAATIEQRKGELGRGEIERQVEAWTAAAAKDPVRFAVVDASQSSQAVLDDALHVINDRLAARQRELSQCSFALNCLGGLHRAGVPYRVIRTSWSTLHSFPRWLLPARPGSPGPLGARLYRPARVRHVAGAVAIEISHRISCALPGRRIPISPEQGIGPAIAETLGKNRVDLAVAATGLPSRGKRAFLSIFADGRLVAFAKVSKDHPEKLEQERAVLEALARCALQRLVVPKVLGFFSWQDCTVLVLAPVETRGRALRPISDHELGALAELSRLSEPLAGTLNVAPGLVPAHGDFAPWNSAPLRGKKLALWDWEEARAGLPLEDLFYWRTQLFGRARPNAARELVVGAFHPDAEVRALARELGVDAAVAPAALNACVSRGLAYLEPYEKFFPRIVGMLREADGLLGAALARSEQGSGSA